MTNCQSKQGTKKVQNLPLLCVESICKFTPASILARLYSNYVPLPGPDWQLGLENVLRKRLPLSLGDDFPFHKEPDAPVQLWDAGGAKVAIVKQPEAFRLSPLRELIDRASLTLTVRPISDYWWTDCRMRLSIVHGEAILSHLPNVTELTLAVQFIRSTLQRDPTALQENDLLASQLNRLLPKLYSLTIHVPSTCYCTDTRLVDLALTDYLCDLALPEMVSLRRLDLPENILKNVLLRAHAVNFTFNPSARRVLSGLTCVHVRKEWGCCIRYPNHGRRSDLLRFLSPLFSHVTTLMMIVDGDFSLYLVAFRALSRLSSLGLHMRRGSGPEYLLHRKNESDAIVSVLDLRFHCSIEKSLRPKILAIASLFPNAKAVAFQPQEDYVDALELAAECCTKQVLPAVEKLSCFYRRVYYNSHDTRSKRLKAFIGSSNLPEAVDLSPMIFGRLGQDPDLLTAIYRAMQLNSTKSLLMRGPIHREALSVLQRRVDLNGEKVRLTAWKDCDLGAQPPLWFRAEAEISQQTDFKIVGTKTGGSLKGQLFTIRVLHQLTKPRRIFDFVEMS